MNQYATDAAIMEMIHRRPVDHSSDMKGIGGVLDYVVLETRIVFTLGFFPFD